MALQFVPGNSGAGKSFQLYQKILQEAGNTSGEKVSGDRTGTVYDADTEGTGSFESTSWNHERGYFKF